MNKIVFILSIFLSCVVSVPVSATNARELSSLPKANKNALADSIMREVIRSAENYQKTLSKYSCRMYIKGYSTIQRQNYLIRFAHHIFPVNRKNKEMVFEMVTHSIFNAPNHYFHKFEAVNGNSIPNKQQQNEVLNFLDLNVYSPTAYKDKILLPVAPKAFKVYTFKVEGFEDTPKGLIYKISFKPKYWSPKLVRGNLFVVDKLWSIDKIEFSGIFSFAEFDLSISFSRDFSRFILPVKADLSIKYNVLGNKVSSTYHSAYNYNSVEWIEEDKEAHRKMPLDQTSYYQLSSDTVSIIRDTTYWQQKRDIALTPKEDSLINMPTKMAPTVLDTGNVSKYLKITSNLTNTMNFDYKTTRIKYSGLLNPFQLGYSGRNGITYRQRIRISKTFDKDRQIRFRPEIGFVFKRKEVFFKVVADWEYNPSRLGVVSLTIGNDNQSYSSEIMKDIDEQLKDSSFTFDALNLKYFKHYFVEVRNNFELFNGFQLSAGVSYHLRIPVKTKSDIDVGGGVTDIINDNFNDFTPVVGITYTPRQYYKMDGYRKEYLYSNYPTIALEIARGIPGVGKSSGNYGRIEVDIHQSIALGLLQRLNYHVSGGLFTDQKSTYFADYRFFARRNFPESWEDRFGGVFNQLKGQWYNASDKYLQAHLMYQSPFVLSRLFKRKASQYILEERFYLSQLWLPVLPNYTEIGYGFGNNLFNIALFAGFERARYKNIGLKFSFDLFE